MLGRAIADCVQEQEAVRCILLRGDLGSGKTTLVRFIAEALPGGDKAEVSSPSFTLCNAYPTAPPVLHCDLYRVGGSVPEELDAALDDGAELCLVEWAEHIPPAILPKDFLDIELHMCDVYRIIHIRGQGRGGADFTARLRIRLGTSIASE